jgi:hypothetical protein
MIIDHLHDCKPALRCCALVSRAWLPASRFHLFRSIMLRPSRRAHPYPHCCNKLYALIRRSPHLAAIISELYIENGIWCDHMDWVHDTPCLALLLNSLTHLNTLHLIRVDWSRQPSELRGAFHRVFISNPISNFIFELCDFPFSSLLSILNTCSTSISLILSSFRFSKFDISPVDVETVEKEKAGHVGLENKCRFHDLRIIRCPPGFVSWLNNPENGPDLSRLHTLHCDCDELSGALLLQLGECLQHLCLDAPRGHSCMLIPSMSLVVLHSRSHQTLRPWSTSLVYEASRWKAHTLRMLWTLLGVQAPAG